MKIWFSDLTRDRIVRPTRAPLTSAGWYSRGACAGLYLRRIEVRDLAVGPRSTASRPEEPQRRSRAVRRGFSCHVSCTYHSRPPLAVLRLAVACRSRCTARRRRAAALEKAKFVFSGLFVLLLNW